MEFTVLSREYPPWSQTDVAKLQSKGFSSQLHSGKLVIMGRYEREEFLSLFSAYLFTIVHMNDEEVSTLDGRDR
jgi:hypothetical protein